MHSKYHIRYLLKLKYFNIEPFVGINNIKVRNIKWREIVRYVFYLKGNNKTCMENYMTCSHIVHNIKTIYIFLSIRHNCHNIIVI